MSKYLIICMCLSTIEEDMVYINKIINNNLFGSSNIKISVGATKSYSQIKKLNETSPSHNLKIPYFFFLICIEKTTKTLGILI